MNARLLSILLLATAGAVHAQAPVPAEPAAATSTADTSAEPVAPAAVAASAKPEKICTREKPMGSNRTVRVCRDASAAAARAESDREALERAQRERFNPADSLNGL